MILTTLITSPGLIKFHLFITVHCHLCFLYYEWLYKSEHRTFMKSYQLCVAWMLSLSLNVTTMVFSSIDYDVYIFNVRSIMARTQQATQPRTWRMRRTLYMSVKFFRLYDVISTAPFRFVPNISISLYTPQISQPDLIGHSNDHAPRFSRVHVYILLSILTDRKSVV